MGRPAPPVETFGKIGFLVQPGGRDPNACPLPRLRRPHAAGVQAPRSRAAAQRALKSELTSRQALGGSGTIRSSMRIEEFADVWLVAAHDWSTGTERTYRSVINKQVKPALGELRVREVSPGVVSRAIAAIAKSSGAGAAKSTRACLSGMFGLAILDGAIAGQPDARLDCQNQFRQEVAARPDGGGYRPAHWLATNQ